MAATILHPPQGVTHSTGRRRRPRTAFSAHDIALLEDAFLQTQYPDIVQREDLARHIGKPEARIQTWFQNKRSRKRKHGARTGNRIPEETKEVDAKPGKKNGNETEEDVDKSLHAQGHKETGMCHTDEFEHHPDTRGPRLDYKVAEVNQASKADSSPKFDQDLRSSSGEAQNTSGLIGQANPEAGQMKPEIDTSEANPEAGRVNAGAERANVGPDIFPLLGNVPNVPAQVPSKPLFRPWMPNLDVPIPITNETRNVAYLLRNQEKFPSLARSAFIHPLLPPAYTYPWFPRVEAQTQPGIERSAPLPANHFFSGAFPPYVMPLDPTVFCSNTSGVDPLAMSHFLSNIMENFPLNMPSRNASTWHF